MVGAQQRGHRRGYTMTEIAIVAAVISIIVAIAVPTWLRQRELARASACQENLAKIDDAKEVYAMEFRVSNGSAINFPDDLLQPPGSAPKEGYLRQEPRCQAGGSYTAGVIGEDPTCSIGTTNAPFPPHVLTR